MQMRDWIFAENEFINRKLEISFTSVSTISNFRFGEPVVIVNVPFY